jgi:hypothetical protein
MNPAACPAAPSCIRAAPASAVFICFVALSGLPARSATLGEALDNPSLNWQTGGPVPWIAQTAESHDGSDAAQSGLIADLEESWVTTTVSGPGPLSFWWKVSSELDYDEFHFLIDDVDQANISGTIGGCEQRTFDIPAGVHSLTWRYQKDATFSEGLDRAWLDEVSYIPKKGPTNLILNLSHQAIIENDSVTLSGSFVDPDATDTHSLLIDWRDGTSTATNLAAGVYAFNVTHQYRDDDPQGSTSDIYPINVIVADDVGAVSGSAALTISNAPPVVVITSLNPALFPYDTAVLSGVIADIGTRDNLRLSINWGDTATIETNGYGPGAHSFVLRHTYALANTNVQITITAMDDDEGRSIARTNITIRPLPARARILSLRKGETGQALIGLQGTPLANYQVQSSTDLIHWLTIAIRTANAGGFFDVDDPGGFTYQRLFYRANWESQSAGMRFSSIKRNNNGSMALRLIAVPGKNYLIESTTNLINWNPALVTTADSNGIINYNDSATTPRRKFYRAVVP